MSDLVEALHAELAAIHGVKPEGHSLTGDYAALKADAERLARVAEGHMSELQAEVDRLRANLACATGFLVGPFHVQQRPGDHQWELWPDSRQGMSRAQLQPPEVLSDRDTALERAREHAQEA